jgi:hypothetical protein
VGGCGVDAPHRLGFCRRDQPVDQLGDERIRVGPTEGVGQGELLQQQAGQGKVEQEQVDGIPRQPGRPVEGDVGGHVGTHGRGERRAQRLVAGRLQSQLQQRQMQVAVV